MRRFASAVVLMSSLSVAWAKSAPKAPALVSGDRLGDTYGILGYRLGSGPLEAHGFSQCRYSYALPNQFCLERRNYALAGGEKVARASLLYYEDRLYSVELILSSRASHLRSLATRLCKEAELTIERHSYRTQHEKDNGWVSSESCKGWSRSILAVDLYMPARESAPGEVQIRLDHVETSRKVHDAEHRILDAPWFLR